MGEWRRGGGGAFGAEGLREFFSLSVRAISRLLVCLGWTGWFSLTTAFVL